MSFLAHVAFSAVTTYQVSGQLGKTQGISLAPESQSSEVQWFCLGAFAPGMHFALEEYAFLRTIDYRALKLGHWLVGPPCMLASLDFLLDTVPFSFNDPTVNHRRVVGLFEAGRAAPI